MTTQSRLILIKQYSLHSLCSVKEGLVRVFLTGGGEANKKTFFKDLNKESKGQKKVGAAFRLAMALMEDGKLWLQVCTAPVTVIITCARFSLASRKVKITAWFWVRDSVQVSSLTPASNLVQYQRFSILCLTCLNSSCTNIYPVTIPVPAPVPVSIRQASRETNLSIE